MDFLSNLALGFSTALSFDNLIYAAVGCILGTLIGVLPGLGPLTTISMLLPFTFGLDPIGALIMLAGIYYGAAYGGSTTAILVNLPGEASAVVTTLDGYQMARQGRAGSALAVAALGSFFAGTVATFGIAIAGPMLAGFALNFGPAEYVSLMIFGLLAATILASGPVLKAIGMILIGLLFGMVGTDQATGAERLTFGSLELFDGIEFTVIAIGLFGFSEIIANLERSGSAGVTVARLTRLWPTREDFRRAWPAVLRGTGIGTFLGILPGGGATLASFSAYSLEKKVSRTPEKFGTGVVQGVASPEAANNAAAQSSFIPLLTLGIPSNNMMAMMLSAFMIHGITPGPSVLTSQPEIFWGLVASMWIGNALLVIINMPLIGLWVKLLTVPYRLLYPAILLFCCVGVYSMNNRIFDVLLAAGFGLLGYAFRKAKCEPGPLLLGFVLGPLLESNLRRTMLITQGDASIFVERPISLVMLIATVILLALMILPSFRKKREEAFQEEEA